jgi:hypothetical protein
MAMPAADFIHNAVKNALIHDGWTITADPYTIEYEEIKVFADLAAERLLAFERDQEKIVVEIKSFVGRSPIHDLEVALGQYALYQSFLEVTAPERKLYLAITDDVYADVFQQKAVQLVVERYRLAIIVVNVKSEKVVQWKS